MWTQEVTVGGLKIFLSCGEYEDGSLGEVFLNAAPSEAPDNVGSLLSCFARMMSIALQHGTPLEEMADHFLFSAFDPQGLVTGSEHVRMANSVIDYVFRELAVHYLGRRELSKAEGTEGVEPL